MLRLLGAVLLTAALVSGCSASAAKPTTTPEQGQTKTDIPGVMTDTPEPTADFETATLKLGETQSVDLDGERAADITVLKASFASKYGSGYYPDVPKKGNVFIAVQVRYKSMKAGLAYNLWDWQLFVNDEAVSDFAFPSYGPTPRLSSGTLPKGKTATGWLTWEVPKTGRIVVSFGGGADWPPVFQVVLRSK